MFLFIDSIDCLIIIGIMLLQSVYRERSGFWYSFHCFRRAFSVFIHWLVSWTYTCLCFSMMTLACCEVNLEHRLLFREPHKQTVWGVMGSLMIT